MTRWWLVAAMLLPAAAEARHPVRSTTTTLGPSSWKNLRELRGGGTLIWETPATLATNLVARPLLCSGALWTIMAVEMIRHAQGISQKQLTGVRQELQEHRHEKARMVQDMLRPLALVLTVSCLYQRVWPWQADLYRDGPSTKAIGLNYVYWVAEVLMDTSLDECSIFGLHLTTAVSCVVQLALIVYLITAPHGHVIFGLKAVEVLLSTLVARLWDHPYWMVVAVLASAALAATGAGGYLAPRPANVSTLAVAAYFAATLVGSTMYQFTQNLPNSVLTNVKLVRALLLCAAMILGGTPASWILFDYQNFVVFGCIKVVTDTVAIESTKRTPPSSY